MHAIHQTFGYHTNWITKSRIHFNSIEYTVAILISSIHFICTSNRFDESESGIKMNSQTSIHLNPTQSVFFLLGCQLSHVAYIYDCPKLFRGLLLCFPEQLLILGDQSIQRHRCLYERVQIRHTSRWLLISLMQSPQNAYQTTALLQLYCFPLRSNIWLTLETLFYPLFWKWQKLLHQNLCNFWTER